MPQRIDQPRKTRSHARIGKFGFRLYVVAVGLAQLIGTHAYAQLPSPSGAEVSPIPQPATVGTIIYVNPYTKGNNDGTSWNDGFVNLQDALATAVSGDEIWVTYGTYTPADFGGSRSATFTLINGVSIYGGFQGNETMRDQRVPSVFVTTLSGDLNDDDGPAPFEDNAENSYHVVSAGLGVGALAILDGFTITAGNANGAGNDASGGGLNILSAGPTIVNCTVLANSCSSSGAGARINTGVGTTTFRSCLFSLNGIGTGAGGALYLGTTSSVAVVASIFQYNSAITGGAIEMSSGTSSLNMANCFLFGNSADTGGAIRVAAGTLTATNCEFTNNTTSGAVGGGAISNIATFSTVTNCTFANNSCASFGRGGGIRHSNSVNSLTVRNSIFWGNSDFDGMLSSSQIYQAAGANDPTVTYSIVQGGWSGPGSNNLSSDPLFFNPAGNDFRVFANSPAVDSADNTVVPTDTLDVDQDSNTNEPVPLALGGIGRFSDNPYVADTGNGVGPIVDRGAWEVRQLVYLYVDEDGLPGIGDWAGAYSNLQDAIFEAQASASAQIWVANGTYYPDLGTGITPGDRTATFELRDHVELYGGFAGFETMLSERDPIANVAILMGDLAGDDGPSFTNRSDNSCHVVTVTGNSTTSVLDGFTIQSGQADCMSANGTFGGGLVVNDPTSPKIRNCRFTDNFGDLGGAVAFNVALDMPGDPEITNCKFDGNQAFNSGGAVRLDLGGTDRAIVTGCSFEGNQVSAGTGGAIRINGNGLDLTNSYFAGNDATYGGGLYSTGSEIDAAGCTFFANTSSMQGGGISSVGGSDVELFNCRFIGNSTDDGGGIHNTANLLATNCVFSGNSGLTGGAVRTDVANPAFVNCTFVDNSAASTGGLHSDGGSILVANSIFWDNIDKGGSGEGAQLRITGGTLDIDYSLVQGLTGSLGGVGNISGNPLFVNPIDNDYRLRAGSPAIDAGNSNSVPSDSADLDGDANMFEKTPLDASGIARFFDDVATPDTGVTAPPLYPVVVDMGAFEYGGVDCNQNGIPDNCDVSCGLANGPCDVPGCGMSDDVDMNGQPDECADFVSECGLPTPQWTCFDNWNLPGDVYPDNMGPATYDVTLDNGDDVLLDVDVTIDSLTMKSFGTMPAAPILRLTQSGMQGDLTIATDKGLRLEGSTGNRPQLLTSGNRMINLLCGPVTVLNSFYGPSPTAPPGSVNSVLNCETLRITQPSGEVLLEDSMSINASVDLIVDGRGATPCESDGGKTTPIKRVFDNASVNVNGNFTLDGNTNFSNASAVNMNVGGSFFNTGTSSNCFDCSQGGITLDGSGAQTFEVSGEDLGASMNGFVHPMGHTNFSWQDIVVTSGATHMVRFQNAEYNGQGTEACNEALYVRTLTLQAGSTITVDNVKVYYLNLVNNGATINTVGCGQLLPVQIACTMNQQCDDSAACTYDDCHMGFCRFTEVEYGNVNGTGPITPNLDDILCVLAGFANINNCQNGDIRGASDTACVPNDVISLDDILAVLGAFSGVDLCGCVP